MRGRRQTFAVRNDRRIDRKLGQHDSSMFAKMIKMIKHENRRLWRRLGHSQSPASTLFAYFLALAHRSRVARKHGGENWGHCTFDDCKQAIIEEPSVCSIRNLLRTGSCGVDARETRVRALPNVQYPRRRLVSGGSISRAQT